MDKQRGTQKQIAKRYQDKVDYRNTRTPWRRARFWISAVLSASALAAIYVSQNRTAPEFFNTGPLSRHHSTLESNCAACHQPEVASDGRFLQVVKDRFRNGAPNFQRIDQACETCHTQHAFHEPNVVENRSCPRAIRSTRALGR